MRSNPSDLNPLIPVAKLASIEADPELLAYRFCYDDFLMWPFVRHSLLFAAQSRGLRFRVPARKHSLTPVDVLRYVYHSFAQNPLIRTGQKDIIIFSSGVVNVPDPVGGGFVNRLYDQFAEEYPDQTLLIEDSYRYRFHRPRSWPFVKYHDLIEVLSWFVSKGNPTPTQDRVRISEFLRYLKKAFDFPVDPATWPLIEGKLHTAARRLRFLHASYKQLFKATNPRVILLEDGSYGERSYIIKWAREHGVATAEYQHGLISRNHLAYNYGPSIRDSLYRDYLPENLLVFGKYWANTVNMPINLAVIGYPYLDKTAEAGRNLEKSPEKDSVLFISSGFRPDLVKDLVVQFHDLAGKEYRCYFRPHPWERSIANNLYAPMRKLGIAFDNGNLYHKLLQVENIVGMEASTVLFEALALGKNVFVLNKPDVAYYVDEPVFNVFDNPADLREKLRKGNHGYYDPGYLFHKDWRTAYREFIDNATSSRETPKNAQ